MGELYVDMEYPHIKYTTADDGGHGLPAWAFDAPPPPPRMTLAGSLDPTTGIFYRTPEHPRLRTAQACDKCRTRKATVCSPSFPLCVGAGSQLCAQCSGDHPSCARCLARGLVCEYAKEGRVRGPNRTPRSRHASISASSQPHSPAPLPYSTLSPTGALTMGLGALGKPRRRRTATLPPGAAPPPLASTRPLALPNPKRLSLPAALDLRLLAGAVPQSPYPDARYGGDGDESRRGSYDSYAGEVGYDAYARTLDGFPAHPLPQSHSHPHPHLAHPHPKHHHHHHAGYEQHVPLEAGYALDPVRDSHHQHLDSHHPHHHRLDAYAHHPSPLRIDALNPRRCPASSGMSATGSSSSAPSSVSTSLSES
ncbi:hypothetical protein FB451DRAFT_1464904 [Mycena latifolia]|nr:hypothetical protein FB451DRAFT_1464904 [Mycena latifolia]